MTAPLPHSAVLLNQAADWIDAHPQQWGREWFYDKDGTGCRCALGVITLVSDPGDLDGDPKRVYGGMLAAAILADYLTDQLGAPRAITDGVYDVIETVGGWNDDPARTPQQVADALRAAAARISTRHLTVVAS